MAAVSLQAPGTIDDVPRGVSGWDDAGVDLIAVVGPPAVGKSTMTASVAGALGGAEVFRLREFAGRFRRGYPHMDGLFEPVDALGWFGDPAVEVLLTAAFGPPALAGTVLLENLPGSVAQLRFLSEMAAERRWVFRVVELAAPDTVIAARSNSRRVCAACEPDPRCDPHRPARGRPSDPEVCSDCGGGLQRRHCDAPDRFAARLHRFRARAADLRAAAGACGVPYMMIDAANDPAAVVRAVITACQPTLPSTSSRGGST
jgi:adenylate kinase family enzyme